MPPSLRRPVQPQPSPLPMQHYEDPVSDSDGTNGDEVEDDDLADELEGDGAEEEPLGHTSRSRQPQTIVIYDTNSESEDSPTSPFSSSDQDFHQYQDNAGIATAGTIEPTTDNQHPSGSDRPTSPESPPLPPNLKEISSLASWTVSSSKPGCSIPQLRSPNTNLFWQSDGPQPHLLNIHFFKLVRIVGLRLYLDFEADESYTPTRILFLAGTGPNDLQEWGEMRLEQPRGWIWVDFSGVDDATPSDQDSEIDLHTDDSNTSSDDDNEDEEDDPMNLDSLALRRHRNRRRRRKPRMPVLRAHLVQIKILENHQNGKDTHLRGLQIFAKDKEAKLATRAPARKSIAADQPLQMKALEGTDEVERRLMARRDRRRIVPRLVPGDWDKIPDIR